MPKNRLAHFFLLLIIAFVVHHGTVLIHEWTHGTLAWLAGYKRSPFAIHYGTQWLTLIDINEAVPYEQILADGKPHLIAMIAIAPILLEIIFFFVVVFFLPRVHKPIPYAFLFWLAFFELAAIYCYIPIRTFSNGDDIHHFLFTTGLSSFILAIPCILIDLYGFYRIFIRELPRAFKLLSITSKVGKITFLTVLVVIFFGYYGGVGFTVQDPISHKLSLISWILIPVVWTVIWRATRKTV